jgi:hypothetical protein
MAPVFMKMSGVEDSVLMSKSEVRDDSEYQVEKPLGRSSAHIILWKTVGTVASCQVSHVEPRIPMDWP